MVAKSNQVIWVVIVRNPVRLNMVYVKAPLIGLLKSTALAHIAVSLPDTFRDVVPSGTAVISKVFSVANPIRVSVASDVDIAAYHPTEPEGTFIGVLPFLMEALPTLVTNIVSTPLRTGHTFTGAVNGSLTAWVKSLATFKASTFKAHLVWSAFAQCGLALKSIPTACPRTKSLHFG